MSTTVPSGTARQPEPHAVKGLIAELSGNAKTAAAEFSEVRRVHTALAKAEVSEKITKPVVSGVVAFAIAAVLGLDALMLLFVTAAFGIYAAGLPLWASFGIVVLVLLLIVGILAAVGIAKFKKVGPPERSINAAKHLVERVKTAIG